MKLFIATLLIYLLSCCSNSITRLKNLQGMEWALLEKSNKLIYLKKDSLILLCCALSPTYHSDDTLGFKYPYWIEIEKATLMPSKEIKLRLQKQNLILDSLKKQDGHSKITYSKHISFLLRRNTIDSLRIPIGQKHRQSIYLKDALEEYGYLNLYFKDTEEAKKLIYLRKKIFKSLGIKYHAPHWLDEYLPYEGKWKDESEFNF